MTAEAAEIVSMLDSYTEYSPVAEVFIFLSRVISVDGRKKASLRCTKPKGIFDLMSMGAYDKERSEQVKQLFVFSPIPNRKNQLIQIILVTEQQGLPFNRTCQGYCVQGSLER